MTNFKIFLYLLLLVFNLINSNSIYNEKIDVLLNEVNTKFTFNSKPIHPKLIEKFNSWMADTYMPTVISVDLIAASNNRNEYDNENIEKEDKYISYRYDEGYFSYEWLGKLKNNLHALKIDYSTGGSLTFRSIFFVKFEKSIGYKSNGKKYNRLLMVNVRNYSLSEDEGDIEFCNESIYVYNSNTKTKTILKF